MVPPVIVDALRDAYERSCVDEFWSIWSEGAEAGIFRAYCRAGGPTSAGTHAYLGRGRLRTWRRRSGGKSVRGAGSGRLYRVSRGDDLDVESAQYFVNSSFLQYSLFVGDSSR